MLPEALATAHKLCRESGSVVEERHDLSTLRDGFDVVYTTRWQTMGVPKPDPHWKEKFVPFRVTQELMRRFSKNGQTVFMHDLPAVRGDDVVDEVLDGPQSVAFSAGETQDDERDGGAGVVSRARLKELFCERVKT
jgi:ornithine carbamoyltransferase